MAQEERGEASYYGDDFVGRKTASGELYDPVQLTAAHRSLRFGVRLLVTNLDNGRTVVVTVNDRGPFVKGRIIDLSKAAADELDMLLAGTANVSIHPLKVGESGELPPPPQVYFQMGAFRTQANAFSQARKLRDLGFVPRVRQEGTLFRVFLSAEEGTQSEELLEALVRAGQKGFLQGAREPAGTDITLPSAP